jgi:hypothetical protein
MIPVELARLGNHSNSVHAEISVSRQLSPWIDVRMMIELGDDNLISRVELPAQGARQMEIERRHVCAKHNFI